MNCPYCSNEMELGKVESFSSSPGYIQQKFVSEYESQKRLATKIKEFVQEISMGVMKESISLKNCETAYYCDQCKKVFAEYEVY